VRESTLTQIKSLDVSCKFRGEYGGGVLRVPTLVEFCEFMSRYPDVYLNVEIKDYAHETVDDAVKTLSDRSEGFHESQLKNFVGGVDVTYSKMYAVGIPMRLLTAETCEYFEGQGVLASGLTVPTTTRT